MVWGGQNIIKRRKCTKEHRILFDARIPSTKNNHGQSQAAIINIYLYVCSVTTLNIALWRVAAAAGGGVKIQSCRFICPPRIILRYNFHHSDRVCARGQPVYAFTNHPQQQPEKKLIPKYIALFAQNSV